MLLSNSENIIHFELINGMVMYLQLQHDYILGNYPVGRDDAAQLSALQILVEIGFVSSPESCT